MAEPPRDARQRAATAALVAGTWAMGAASLALGIPRCAVAAIFHEPCPGCGVTRALRLLAAGQVGASVRMHPLAIPALAAALLILASSTWTALATGSPAGFFRARLGRFALRSAAIVYIALLALWAARWFGCFGGPVAVAMRADASLVQRG